MPNKTNTPLFLWLTVVLILIGSFCELAILLVLHRHDLAYFSLNGLGVVEGTPLGKVYQNRLLGPVLAWALSRVFGHFEVCFYVLFCAFWTSANVIMYLSALRLTRREDQARRAVASFILLTLILFWQKGTIFYLWDALDAVFFTLFAYAIFTRCATKYLVSLFLLELLNREAALFISVWMMLSAFTLSKVSSGKALSLKEPARLGIGFALALSCIVLVRVTRDALFRHDLLPNMVLPSAVHLVLGNYWLPSLNLQVIVGGLKHPSPVSLATFGVYPALAAFVFFQRNRLTPYLVQVMVLLALMMISNFCFANAGELRTWIDLLPLLILFHFSREGRDPETAR